MTTKALPPNHFTPGEALVSFLAFLTTRDGTVTLGAAHDCAEAAQLMRDFCAVNNIDPEVDASKEVRFPKYEEGGAS